LFASALLRLLDEDGVINSLDLDSDNAGIYDMLNRVWLDVAELTMQITMHNRMGRHQLFGNNGLHTNIEE